MGRRGVVEEGGKEEGEVAALVREGLRGGGQRRRG